MPALFASGALAPLPDVSSVLLSAFCSAAASVFPVSVFPVSVFSASAFPASVSVWPSVCVPAPASMSPWPLCSTVDLSALSLTSWSVGAEAAGAAPPALPLSWPKTTSEQV